MFAFPNQYLARMTNKAPANNSPSQKENINMAVLQKRHGQEGNNHLQVGSPTNKERASQHKSPVKNQFHSMGSIGDTATITSTPNKNNYLGQQLPQ